MVGRVFTCGESGESRADGSRTDGGRVRVVSVVTNLFHRWVHKITGFFEVLASRIFVAENNLQSMISPDLSA